MIAFVKVMIFNNAPASGTNQNIVPQASSEAALHRMKATLQHDTRAERALQTAMLALGLKFETNVCILEGSTRRVDIVLEQEQLAIFIDGCFWHGCPQHGTWPKRNAEFWREKIERNRARDADTDQRLQDNGWTVIRVWEHENPDEIALRIIATLEYSQCDKNPTK